MLSCPPQKLVRSKNWSTSEHHSLFCIDFTRSGSLLAHLFSNPRARVESQFPQRHKDGRMIWARMLAYITERWTRSYC